MVLIVNCIVLSTKYSEISISEKYFTKEYIFGLSCVSQKLASKCNTQFKKTLIDKSKDPNKLLYFIFNYYSPDSHSHGLWIHSRIFSSLVIN